MDKTELIQSLKAKGFHERIISAFERVRREDFVPENMKKLAYEDIALPLSETETISQPSTIALALSLLKVKENNKVLEIGSGCGYVSALMSEIVGERGKVVGVEISEKLFETSLKNLEGYQNITLYNRNGKLKNEEAPFNRILLSAAVEQVPQDILEQLDENGILVAPVGSDYMQNLVAMRKISGKIVVEKEIPGFIFVRFIE